MIKYEIIMTEIILFISENIYGLMLKKSEKKTSSISFN